MVKILFNLISKWIKRINKDEVKFEDYIIINIKNFDYKLIKLLI